MSLGQLLFSFQGRINRKPWWLTSLAIGAVMLVIIIIAALAAGGALISNDPAAILGALGGLALLILILAIPLIWIGLALGAKRLHDRNKSAWWLVVFYLVPGVLQGIGEQVGGVGLILSLAGFAISIWGLVELGFLRGTVGPNQYGSDPLEGQV
jgi:uncharacterized membrane protein YhaH (DUF805 family)